MSSILVSQTYVRVNQNRDWNADATQSTVFFKIKDTNLEITPNLSMLLFRNQTASDPKPTYGGAWVDTSVYTNHNPIPSGWTYEISNASGDVPVGRGDADAGVQEGMPGRRARLSFEGDTWSLTLEFLKV